MCSHAHFPPNTKHIEDSAKSIQLMDHTYTHSRHSLSKDDHFRHGTFRVNLIQNLWTKFVWMRCDAMDASRLWNLENVLQIKTKRNKMKRSDESCSRTLLHGVCGCGCAQPIVSILFYPILSPVMTIVSEHNFFIFSKTTATRQTCY